MTQTQREFHGRSTYIDALRGIAALGVACYHIARYEPGDQPARELIPGFMQAAFDYGWVGVQVFFVISGFVIAYSLRAARVTPGFFANYALRRSIRLDPPYWTTILFVLLLHAVLHLHLGFDSPLDVPTPLEPELSWKLVGSHLLYLQNIIPGYDNLSAGFWTLCIEVQFYILCVAGLGIAQQFPARNRRFPADAGATGLLIVFLPLALFSLFEWNKTVGGLSVYDNDMWISRFFSMFFLGSAAWWALDGRIPRSVFGLYASAFAGRILMQGWRQGWNDDLTIGLSAALAAGLSTYVAGRLGRLGTWLDFRSLQYLGRISYSLYLIHFPMSYVIMILGYEVLGPPGPLAAVLWLVLALAASLAAAHVLYRFIEAPSVRLAARLKRSTPKATPPVLAAPSTPPAPAAVG